MSKPLVTQAASLVLAVIMTAGMLSGVATLAHSQLHEAAPALAAQQVTIVGQRGA